MLLINFKLESERKWTSYYVSASNAADNDNANSNNIKLTIKDTKLFLHIVPLSVNDNEKLGSILRGRGVAREGRGAART